MSDEIPAIGIDLGTTNSCAAVLLNDQINMIHGDDGSYTMASFVFFENSGDVLVGNLATDRAYRNPKNAIYGVKRFIGRTYNEFKNEEKLSTFPYTVEDKLNKPNIIVEYQGKTIRFVPEEISAMILSKLKERAEEKLGQKITKAVITVPAHFNGIQRQATIDAGNIAGLEVLRVINEPTAAILAFELNKKYEKCNVLVYDFGGGTFDVSVAIMDKENIDIKASNGEAFLGGIDLNNNLTEYLINYFFQKNKVDLRKSIKTLERLKQQVEKAKIMLSSALFYDLNLDYIDDSDLDLDFQINRSLFQHLNMNLFTQTIKCVEKTVDEAGMKKEDIDEILLVGGSTRIPYVRKIVKDYFGKEPNASIHPDEVVARGAAIQAAISNAKKCGRNLGKSLNVSDICSLSLGIDLDGGYMSTIIPRNTKIPTKKTNSYHTVFDNQPIIYMGIYEGEHLMASQNKLLADFELSGIRQAPAGEVKHEVTFEIDESGILTATAVEKGTANTSEISVSIYKNNLTREEINEMIEKGNMFKNDESKSLAALLPNKDSDDDVIIL